MDEDLYVGVLEEAGKYFAKQSENNGEFRMIAKDLLISGNVSSSNPDVQKLKEHFGVNELNIQ